MNNTPDLQANRRKRNGILTGMCLLILIVAIATFVIWWLFYKDFQTTEDAYVGGDIIVLNARKNGTVISFYSENTHLVKEGEILVQLDPTDSLAILEQKKSALAQAARQVRGLYEKVKEGKANVKVETAKYERTALDFVNREEIVESEAIAKEDFDHSQADFKIAEATLELARNQLEAALVEVGQTELKDHPIIQNAKIDVIIAYLDLQRCNVYSPASGYVANRNVQVGESIQSSTALMDIVPLNTLWVDANFKETQLENMRIGQSVTLISDMYGNNVTFHGKIVGLQAGSGSTFSLLPAQNATGNWIKIVQRVPVRISLDSEEIKKYPLVVGLTMYASIDISNQSGPILAEKPIQKKTQTNVYKINLDEAHRMIDNIIETNLQQNGS